MIINVNAQTVGLVEIVKLISFLLMKTNVKPTLVDMDLPAMYSPINRNVTVQLAILESFVKSTLMTVVIMIVITQEPALIALTLMNAYALLVLKVSTVK